MLAIEMSGNVYCPLSPRDPEHRLHALVQQTQSCLVLVHSLTRPKFNHHIVSCDVDLILSNINMMLNVDQLSNVLVSPNNIAYTIFTSGSTGTPKAVR
jgi:non-ribosomal peptide synthetase component F